MRPWFGMESGAAKVTTTYMVEIRLAATGYHLVKKVEAANMNAALKQVEKEIGYRVAVRDA